MNNDKVSAVTWFGFVMSLSFMISSIGYFYTSNGWWRAVSTMSAAGLLGASAYNLGRSSRDT